MPFKPEAKLMGIISAEEHAVLSAPEVQTIAAQVLLSKLGTLGLQNEYAILAHRDTLDQRILDGYVSLSPVHQGDLVVADEQNLSNLGLPSMQDATTVMAAQHRKRLMDAVAYSDTGSMLRLFRPQAGRAGGR